MKMDIKHLQYFEKALIEWDKLYAYEPLQSKPLDISQIIVIEKALYKTESKTLPDVLRELLLLSGGYCPFFETGIHPTKKNTLDINDLLEDQNYNPYFRFLSRNDALNCFENRIIWCFNTGYESSDEFYFVYLDEDENDPLVYTFDGDRLYELDITNFNSLIHSTKKHLSSFIYQLYVNKMRHYYRPIFDESIFSSFLHPNTDSNLSKNLQNFYSFIFNRNLSGVNFFIEHDIDVTANNNQAILNAAAVSDLKAIDLLVKHGANLYAQNEKILLVSAKFGDPIFLRDLIDKYEFSQVSKNKALVIACSIGIRTSTLYLIRSGAEVNAYNSLCLQIALRNHHFDLATELANDFEANKRVNSGFLLLFKEEIEQQVTHKYSKKMLFDNVSLLDSLATLIYKQRIINKHYSDLRKFYGNESVVLDKFPSKTNIEIDK